MKKMEMDVGQMKMEAWGQFAIAATGAAFTAASTALHKKGKGTTVRDITNSMSRIGGYGQNLQTLGRGIVSFASLGHAEESANLEASIMRKQTSLKLIKSIASTVESSLKDIDSTRERFHVTAAKDHIQIQPCNRAVLVHSTFIFVFKDLPKKI
jgi:hypothetical protein